MAVRELGYSKARALEQAGENDPEVVMAEARQEALAELALEVERQRQLAQVGDAAGATKPLQETTPVSGPGFNPAQGGTHPVEMSPGLTPEVVKGERRKAGGEN